MTGEGHYRVLDLLDPTFICVGRNQRREEGGGLKTSWK